MVMETGPLLTADKGKKTILVLVHHPYQMSDIMQKYCNGHLSSVLTYSSDGEDLYPAIRV